MRKVSKALALVLVCLVGVLALAPMLTVKAQGLYLYSFQGPFFMNGDAANGGGLTVNSVVCKLVWNNFTTTSMTLSTSGPFTVNVYSDVELYQMTWNASSALNYTSLIDFKPFSNGVSGIYVPVYIPDPALPFALYTFPVTDFAGMTNAYLEMSINNATGLAGPAQQVSLNAAGIPTFVMTQYYTYTLTFINGDGRTYSQQFTAENTLNNFLAVPAAAFYPSLNVTAPSAFVERINSTLIGITYVDPSNTTSSGSVLITHPSGLETITDYLTTNVGNSTTILWNVAEPGTSYNVNFTAIIGGQPYVWVLVAPQVANANPFAGVFDWLGQNTATMPHVQTGWPVGMTSAQIGEIAGACIVMLFLCIGSFRSAGACCMLSWIIFGILLYMGWLGVVSAWVVPEFAFSGFIGILIMLDEAKSQAREV